MRRAADLIEKAEATPEEASGVIGQRPSPAGLVGGSRAVEGGLSFEQVALWRFFGRGCSGHRVGILPVWKDWYEPRTINLDVGRWSESQHAARCLVPRLKAGVAEDSIEGTALSGGHLPAVDSKWRPHTDWPVWVLLAAEQLLGSLPTQLLDTPWARATSR
jgi:hypothetical protein